MKVALGCDHAGFEYKERIKEYLRELGHEPVDFGAFDAEASDYPDFVRPAAEAVPAGQAERVIVLGGSGNGEAIVANKVSGVRCGLVWSDDTALWCRQHNDANGISLGARTITVDDALRFVKIFLETPFDGGRHARRIAKI